MCRLSRREESWWSPQTAQISRVNRKLDLHWILPESPIYPPQEKFGFKPQFEQENPHNPSTTTQLSGARSTTELIAHRAGLPLEAPLGFDGELKKSPTDTLRPIIPDKACIFYITAVAGTELADAYSLDTVISSSLGKEVHDLWAFYLHAESRLCLSPSMADHPLGPAIDHRIGKLLPHQLANQERAPPRADSSFCSLAYG
ncbi:hypothetical protein Gogos_020878, partial [Gossypium gossypioides]|nr:hypothetical protein [Gossypium gossypioides]